MGKVCNLRGRPRVRSRSPSEPQVLSFLQTGLDKGFNVNTLRIQISALTALSGVKWASWCLICQFLKACARIRPAERSYVPPWDLQIVLDFLSQAPFKFGQTTSLWNISLKAVFLTAITSGRRVSDIQALGYKPPYCCHLADRVVLQTLPHYRPKVNTPFHRNQEIVLPTFQAEASETPHNLDVGSILKTYIEMTASLRKTENLFIIPEGSRKGLAASARTLASWLVKVIWRAYTAKNLEPPAELRAHSTRGMEASWANFRGVTLELICRAVATFNTFLNHYKVDPVALTTVQFGYSVLEQLT